MADAVKAVRKNVREEPTDKLVGGKRHDIRAFGSMATITLVTQCDAGLVKRDEPPVRDSNPVDIARQIGEHCFQADK